MGQAMAGQKQDIGIYTQLFEGFYNDRSFTETQHGRHIWKRDWAIDSTALNFFKSGQFNGNRGGIYSVGAVVIGRFDGGNQVIIEIIDVSNHQATYIFLNQFCFPGSIGPVMQYSNPHGSYLPVSGKEVGIISTIK